MSTDTPGATSTAPSTGAATAKKSGGQLTDNPLVLLAGGVAIGAAVGALLPRLAKERELLDPVGRKLAERATAAAQAAKDVGKAEIDALLPARADAKEKVSALFGTVIDAAREAAKA